MLEEIARGVYVQDDFEGGNVGVIVAGDRALLVDTPMLPPDARRWRQTVESLGAASIYGIVNTDYHPENVLGNAAFRPVRTWGHESAAKPIAKYNLSGREQLGAAYRARSQALADEIAATELALPEIEVDDRMVLYLGGRRIVIYYMEGHTPSSLGVYLPDEQILLAGENVTNGAEPVMFQANTLPWLATLQRIKGMRVDRIVPGEGAMCGKEALDPLIAHITDLRERTLEFFRRGASRRETVEKIEIPERFAAPDEQSVRAKRRRRENLERVYTEIRISERKK
ncbi:MAG TPA: MBL fold metallo-hydrolase [Armatimonadota bacterium]|nr:MBL fold metallo-hydrolase [Armatimonadota bacterium]